MQSALLWRGNAMIFFKFEDTACKTVLFKHNFTTSAGPGHFCFEILAKKVAREKFRKISVFTGVFFKLFTPNFFFSRVKIGPIDHARFHAEL